MDSVKHIYCNPTKPQICPILALSVYIFSITKDCKEKLLFPGSSQSNRFSKNVFHEVYNDFYLQAYEEGNRTKRPLECTTSTLAMKVYKKVKGNEN